MTAYPVKSPRKLIEVALPLDAINTAAAKEKSIRHGHPSTLHLWWARRPLAAARAVIFAQLVNDPGYQQGGGFKYGKNKKEAAIERKRLFRIIEDLVLWENTNNEEVLETARAEIRRSWREVCELNSDHPEAASLFDPDKLPALHDPFAGGGTIPLEAQRLGMKAYASDLNPVAVLINKAMIEIPPKFAGRSPVGPLPASELETSLDLPKVWPGATGLAEDVRRYGAWVRAEAQKQLGRLYPPAEVTPDMVRERPDLQPLVGQKLTVIAWLWARTIKSPNPAFSHVDVPLASTFLLSNKDRKETYVLPIIEGDSYRFTVKVGASPSGIENGTKLGRGANFRCLMSDIPIDQEYIRGEFVAKRFGQRLMAIVAEGQRGRVYLPPTVEMERVAQSAKPVWWPDVEMNQESKDLLSGRGYGFKYWHELFTQRQLVALTTFSNLVAETKKAVLRDAIVAGLDDDGRGLEAGGSCATAYAEAVSVYLALAVSKMADAQTSLCRWKPSMDQSIATFGRQALPMVWDFSEANALGGMAGDFLVSLFNMMRVLERLGGGLPGKAVQADAQTQTLSAGKTVSTDPPYYNNIGYADLSDFFYIWLRPALRSFLPSLFATVAVPKAEELVATPYRHGGAEKAEAFFLLGMTQAMASLATQAHPANPTTIFYAFKQSETDDASGTSSTGWETFLEAVNRAGFQLSGTWPMRTEMGNRQIAAGNNALASSIVLVCRKRPLDAATISRREFLRELNTVLPEALDEMTKGSGDDRSPVAPVDLSQAILGPGMAVFSKYAAVLEADGKPMSVHSALLLINRFLAEDDFDPDTQFCLHWFEQYGWGEGRFGDADTLSRAKGTNVDGVRDAGVVESGGGVVRLRKWSEYPEDWNPRNDMRLSVWEALHQFIRTLKNEGETAAGRLLAVVTGKSEATRQLAYRLHTLCERRGWAEDARAYNELITSWTGIEAAASAVPTEKTQGILFE